MAPGGRRSRRPEASEQKSRPRSDGRRGAVVLGLILAAGCATARNYEDSKGPVLAGEGAPPSPGRAELRVVTFNVKFAEHVDRAVALLSRPGPLRDADLLVLQEMDEPGTEKVARALGLNHVYVPSAVHPSSHRDFGVAILSPWPLEDPRKVPLPHEHRFRHLRRAAAVATAVTPLGHVRVYGVHLESPSGLWGGDRREQARAVLADASSWAGLVVVAGDFNGRGGAEEIAKAGFLWLTERVGRSAFLFAFDHVLVRGLCPAGSGAAGVAKDETDASDHDPVWAVLRPCPPA
jgi:endonuclease/exonuclease/phosphatase family metal-dependent hydrolase